jgi:photosystem II stability/assembly factor-like uncharacterized protein
MVSKDEGWVLGRKHENGKEISAIFHYKGEVWEVYTTLPDTYLGDIYMVTANDGWIVGWRRHSTGDQDVVFHYDGDEWQMEVLPERSIWPADLQMISNNEGLAVGTFGTLHYANGEWEKQAPEGLNELSLVSASEGWAIGGEGDVLVHYTQGKWAEAIRLYSNVWTIHMLTPDDGWAAGDSGLILHYQNGQWNKINY